MSHRLFKDFKIVFFFTNHYDRSFWTSRWEAPLQPWTRFRCFLSLPRRLCWIGSLLLRLHRIRPLPPQIRGLRRFQRLLKSLRVRNLYFLAKCSLIQYIYNYMDQQMWHNENKFGEWPRSMSNITKSFVKLGDEGTFYRWPRILNF